MTILYNRRQSLKTLYDYTNDFELTGPDEFKRKIEAYFKLTIKLIILKNILVELLVST